MKKYFLFSLFLTLTYCKPLENKKLDNKSIIYKSETNRTHTEINGFSFDLIGKWNAINSVNNILPINPHCVGVRDVFGNEIEITIFPFQGLDKNVNHNISNWNDNNLSYTLLKNNPNYQIFEVLENKVKRLRLFGINSSNNFYITHFNRNISNEKNISFIENIFEQIK